jgi:O-antigen/teichoic acid export membrane protein
LYVLQFFWPLGLIMAIQGFSRPLINLFVSREAGGAESLAVLTIVYALAHLLYGWLNELRNLPSAFQDEENSLQHIRRFALGCGLVSFGMMIVAYWTPLRVVILDRLMGLSPDLTVHSAAPLIVFSFFPLVVMARAYLHGVGLLEHRTQAMAPSAPLRILAILAALLLLPVFGIHGATRGVAALLAGFVVETITVWWGIRGRAYRRQRASKLAGPAHQEPL